MKTVGKSFSLVAASWFLIAAELPAQTLSVLHTFSANTFSNTDGAGPATELILSGNTVYGVAGGGAFSITATNAVDPAAVEQFYILQTQ